MNMNISDSIRYIGVNDRKIDLFEGQYTVPNGMAYNSYVIIDDKIAVMDTVEAEYKNEWLNNLKTALNGRNPDFLVISHMEPDHSANIINFLNEYPKSKVVTNSKSLTMIKNFFGVDLTEKTIIVKDGEALSLGSHTLNFIFAPMVHWPEVMVTYESLEKVLFSADGFGKFGAYDTDEDWACEARRYYFGIVGKYGAQMQTLLKKAAALNIEKICPLHGPVLTENLSYYTGLYNTWSTYEPESDGVCICYCSVYGNTKHAAEILTEKLKENGCPKVTLNDLARCDMAEAIEDCFRYNKLVLACPTYNADLFPFMKQLIDGLTERNYQNRTVAFIENGSWVPVAAKLMREKFEKCKNISFTDSDVKILSAVNDENLIQLDLMAKELYKK